MLGLCTTLRLPDHVCFAFGYLLYSSGLFPSARLQDAHQTALSQTPTSNASIIPNHGDETSSVGVLRRPMSEGEAVTRDLRQVNLHDPQSPSSAAAASTTSPWPLPKKRPSNNTLPEGDARAAKLHGRARSGPDPFLNRGSSHSGHYPNSHDATRAISFHRPLTPRMTNPSPLGQRFEGSSHHLSNKQAGNLASMEGLQSTATSATDIFNNDVFPQSGNLPVPEMLKQVTTRPITQDQLINEVKGASLMVMLCLLLR